jgi:hypothetical protein
MTCRLSVSREKQLSRLLRRLRGLDITAANDDRRGRLIDRVKDRLGLSGPGVSVARCAWADLMWL